MSEPQKQSDSPDAIVPRLHETETLGSVRLRQEHTGAPVLIPQPSDDPNDPLRWTNSFKIYLAVMYCLALTWVNFFAAGPAVALVEVVIDLFGAYPPDPTNPASLSPESIAAFKSGVNKASFLYSSASLVAGVSNLVWIPLAVKYGRRVVLTTSFLAFGLCCVWSGQATSFSSLLASRILGAWFSGSAECIVPLIITDVFFLHQRGRMMALYSFALATGAALGSVVAGALSITQTWRVFYYLCAGLVLFTTVLVFFTTPETAFQRKASAAVQCSVAEQPKKLQDEARIETLEISGPPSNKTYIQRLAIAGVSHTDEPLWKITIRPLPMIILPPVLWSSLSFGLGIGIFVILSTTAATSYQQTWGFTTWQVGLVWMSCIIGNLVGIPFGGHFSDRIADRATRNNGGIREPEMRLPAMTIAMIAYPGSLLLFGLGIHFKTHWIVPTLGIFLFSAGSSAAIAISVVYTIDCYRPIAGEVTVTQITFKSAITFLMGFYANPWIERDGYLGAFTAMAAICFTILSLWIPLYIWGRRIRVATFKWRLMTLMHWNPDREVGE